MRTGPRSLLFVLPMLVGCDPGGSSYGIDSSSPSDRFGGDAGTRDDSGKSPDVLDSGTSDATNQDAGLMDAGASADAGSMRSDAGGNATDAGAYYVLRRPISPSRPMLIVHIDVWNAADPQKIIDLIPEDIRPYVVMNISLSINHTGATGTTCNWKTVEAGYETAKSWLRTCAENRMWALIQPSSGGYSHFPDYDSTTDLEKTVYGEFFRDYPNFLGFNYAEQFWGFDDNCSPSWPTRVSHWANLLKLCNKYGGYVDVSFTGGFYGAALNPVAMIKRNANFAAATARFPENFIIEEKYTMAYGFHDIESVSMGQFLSGHAGHYGIRFDHCGWVPYASEAFPVAAGAAPVVEHLMLTGETVIDGPELIWQQDIKSLANGLSSDGYTFRQWALFPQYENITIDIFRKILDGTIRLLSRKEVIDRSKLVVVSDLTSGTDQALYSSPDSLFSDLYLMNGDGVYLDNKSWFKKTGRYPAIPTVYHLNDDLAKSFKVQIKRSSYSSRWPTTTAKTNELNALFPEEYTGDLYAGRNENGWVTYNPYKSGQTASANIPFKYNTSASMELTYSQYSVGIIKEYSDKVTFYLTNYDNVNTGLKTDVIKINGSSSRPVYSYADRANHQASVVTSNWAGGVFTLSVSHNGPVEINVNCSGSATGRLTSFTKAVLSPPASPPVYSGPRQYEAENFDFRKIAGEVVNGAGSGVGNYQGLGFLKFGTDSTASVRENVTVTEHGAYSLSTRYSVAGGDVTTVDLFVNGSKVASPKFTQTPTYNDWAISRETINLNAGLNIVEFRANAAGTNSVYFDNIVIAR